MSRTGLQGLGLPGHVGAGWDGKFGMGGKMGRPSKMGTPRKAIGPKSSRICFRRLNLIRSSKSNSSYVWILGKMANAHMFCLLRRHELQDSNQPTGTGQPPGSMSTQFHKKIEGEIEHILCLWLCLTFVPQKIRNVFLVSPKTTKCIMYRDDYYANVTGTTPTKNALQSVY